MKLKVKRESRGRNERVLFIPKGLRVCGMEQEEPGDEDGGDSEWVSG